MKKYCTIVDCEMTFIKTIPEWCFVNGASERVKKSQHQQPFAFIISTISTLFILLYTIYKFLELGKKAAAAAAWRVELGLAHTRDETFSSLNIRSLLRSGKWSEKAIKNGNTYESLL